MTRLVILKKASITYTKSNLSAVVKMVREGSSVLLTDYGKPVARIEPVGESYLPVDAMNLSDLEKRGLVRIGRKSLSAAFWKGSPVATSDHSSVLDALLDERRRGR